MISVNPFRDVGNALTLSSTRHCPKSPELTKVVREVVRLQGESGYPQAIIISGTPPTFVQYDHIIPPAIIITSSSSWACLTTIRTGASPPPGLRKTVSKEEREAAMAPAWRRNSRKIGSKNVPLIFQIIYANSIRYVA